MVAAVVAVVVRMAEEEGAGHTAVLAAGVTARRRPIAAALMRVAGALEVAA